MDRELEDLKEKLRIAREALLLIRAEAIVGERVMRDKTDLSDFWKYIATERRQKAIRALERIERTTLRPL